MNKDSFQRKYGKPSRFTDPYVDFTGEEEILNEIICKQNSELDLRDFGLIFQMYLPAADYEEGLYYIPLCFELMEKACPFEANICTSVFWYIEHFKDKFQQDGFYEDCLERTNRLFELFTEEFTVIKEYEPSARYRLSKLGYGMTVSRLIRSLDSCEETWNLLTEFLFGLKDKGSVGSCWWLIISSIVRESIMYEDRPRSFGYKQRKILFEHFHKFGEYAKHFEQARIYLQKKGTYDFLPQFAIVPFKLG